MAVIGGEGKLDFDKQSTFGAIHRPDAAPMEANGSLGDGEAEAHSAGSASASVIESVKGLE